MLSGRQWLERKTSPDSSASPFQNTVTSQNGDTLFETCAVYFHFRVLLELLTLLYNVLLLT